MKEATRLEQSPPPITGGRVIGLDIHPKTFAAAALRGTDALNAKVEWRHDQVDMRELEKWYMRHCDGQDVLVLEAGGCSFETVKRLSALGGHAVVLESFRAGQIGKAYLKTDRIDAEKTGRIYLSGLAHEVWAPDERARQRREVFYGYERALKDGVRAKNRIRGWLNEHALHAPRGLRLTKEAGRDWVLAVRSWTPVQQHLIRTMFDDLWQARSRRRSLRSLMAQEVATEPDLLKMTRLYGLRHITVYALAAVIGDIWRFRTPKQLVAYIGLQPQTHLSGEGGSTGPIAHTGRGDVRALLVQAAHAILNGSKGSDHPLAKWGWALTFRRCRSVAIIGVARKLVVALWYLLRGCFTPLVEITETLRCKLLHLATEIGRPALRQMGYKSAAAFIAEKEKLLLSTV
jgi:transposase